MRIILPFEEVDTGLGELPFGRIFWVDDRLDIVVGELTAQELLEILNSFGQSMIWNALLNKGLHTSGKLPKLSSLPWWCEVSTAVV